MLLLPCCSSSAEAEEEEEEAAGSGRDLSCRAALLQPRAAGWADLAWAVRAQVLAVQLAQQQGRTLLPQTGLGPGQGRAVLQLAVLWQRLGTLQAASPPTPWQRMQQLQQLLLLPQAPLLPSPPVRQWSSGAALVLLLPAVALLQRLLLLLGPLCDCTQPTSYSHY